MTDWKFIVNKWILRRYRTQFYEPRVKKRLRQFKGELFVDIGANIGLYSIYLAKNFRRVYALEPNPRILPVIRRRLVESGVSNVEVIPSALGNRIGRTMLYLDPHSGFEGSTDTILPKFVYKPNVIPKGGMPTEYGGKEGIDVALTTYDAIVRVPADLVKIDVEGAEFLVLEGMQDALLNRRVRNLIVELHNRERKQELEKLLSGYDLEWVDQDHLLCTSK